MILIDTSIWIDHFRVGNTHLSTLLDQQQVLIHPMIIGELACGNLKNRTEILSLLQNLPTTQEASNTEVLYFIEQNKLMGRGVGFIDFHLLSSVALTQQTSLWTGDKRLQKVAQAINLNYDKPHIT